MNQEERSIYSQLSRRGFMGATAGATLAALVGREPVLAQNPVKTPATADAVIVLWMAGGMAQTETFDPKRYTPFERGVHIKDVLSTFPPIPTAVDGIRFTEGLEQIGSVMDRGTVIRSFMAADLGFILHSRHQYHWHTGTFRRSRWRCRTSEQWSRRRSGQSIQTCLRSSRSARPSRGRARSAR